ncbi:hypothetical protein Hs30E_07950 [Lactococcus hodotermopsidis]|uniref:Glycosyltransferase 2-like domain-containing protein n=1 Tax=Pseudolactococcus hodotermopsidis TaxID=2709157 RepID=A0A6A0BCT6_9LACT|nr:glycosyltransferase family 2 protein [Lactococcus hodotermopsidis]GFH42244.1 hypothetical protein Hs30E_07950 [Lactococcus hodotermopsidis]
MLLSVIVTTYNLNKLDEKNEEPIIKQTLNSLVNQTFDKSKFEVIIIDDCSVDGTFEIIKEYERDNENMKAYTLLTNSGGPSKPRNVGLSFARSEYVTFLDGDDYYGKYAFEKIANHILKEDFDLAYLKRFSPDGRSVPRGSAHGNSLVMRDSDIIQHWMYSENAPGIKVIKRELIANNCIYFNESVHWGEDRIFGMELLTQSSLKTIILNDYEYYYWRTSIAEQGLTAKKWSKEMYHQNAHKVNEFLNQKIAINPENIYFKELWYKFFSYEFRSLPMVDEELIKNVISYAKFELDFSKFDKDIRNKVILSSQFGLSFSEIENLKKKRANVFTKGKQSYIYKENETYFRKIEYFPSLDLDLTYSFVVEKCEFSEKKFRIIVVPNMSIPKDEFLNINLFSQTVIEGQEIEVYFSKIISDFEIIFELDYLNLIAPKGPKGWWKLIFEFDETRKRMTGDDFSDKIDVNFISIIKEEGSWKLTAHPNGFIDLHWYPI